MNPNAVEGLQKWRESGATVEQKNPYQKWQKNNTRKTAIASFCMNCMGTDDPDNPIPGYRSFIKECSSVKCPLYEWRPYKTKEDVEDGDAEDKDKEVSEENLAGNIGYDPFDL